MGRAATQVFVREGARVLGADISGRLEETAAALGEAVVPCKVDSPRSSRRIGRAISRVPSSPSTAAALRVFRSVNGTAAPP
jgi:hypothetical protein